MSRCFIFKQFTINDHGCGMPISTDGVLLGAWAKLPQQGHIVDIGTGSGLLALMAAQRTLATTITAIELDSIAVAAATANFAASPWQSRLQCIESEITHWCQHIPPLLLIVLFVIHLILMRVSKHSSNIVRLLVTQTPLVINSY